LTPLLCPALRLKKNKPNSLPPKVSATIASGTSSTTSSTSALEIDSSRSSRNLGKHPKPDTPEPKTSCGLPMNHGCQENSLESNGADQTTHGGATIGYSGLTPPSERSSPQTTATTSAQSRISNSRPRSGDTILQMLQGQEGTRHLERLASLRNTITQIFDSIPHNSSTILPSVDSYITTLAFANITEFIALNAP
jgi:hypothetical protein